ncbi:YicC/YloC family endoribonuclease [Mucisphaera sp.]|uniref:YicC/YloC family endoribonuclease n=1 Tax=Mucisphaera sp. TaxID=2913024 RepID=UPI003D11B458
MIRSMTGFGGASEEADGVHYAVEVRSVNNRYFKSLIRLPEELVSLEGDLESGLRQRFTRGSLTLTVKHRISEAGEMSRINDEALLGYIQHLETLRSKVDGLAVQVDLTQLLTLPGVLQPSELEEQLVERSKPVVDRLLGQAADRLEAMRQTEGEALARELLELRQQINQHLETVKNRAPLVIDEYHERLRGRVAQLMAKAELEVAQADLIREVAVYADRIDITEEITRINGHLEQFEAIVRSDQGEPAGRRLDFLAQELLREANTIGSKSNDATIARAVVEIKSAIDRIKEQVQNVE